MYGTIHAFKGLDAPAVILTDIDDVSGAAAEALLYVGLTRATTGSSFLASVTRCGRSSTQGAPDLMTPDPRAPRDTILQALRDELFGPDPGAAASRKGKPLDTRAPAHFDTWKEARGPWHDATTGEEILHDIEPVRRYGVAVLYPAREEPDPLAGAVGLATADETSEDSSPPAPEIQGAAADPVEVDAKDFDLSLANAYQPSAMAVSLRARLPAGSQLLVEGAMGRYEQLPVHVAETDSNPGWWVRRPVQLRAAFEAEALASSSDGYACTQPSCRATPATSSSTWRRSAGPPAPSRILILKSGW